MKSIVENLVDKVWTDRPSPAYSEIVALPYSFSGKRISEKLVDVRKELKTLGAETHVVTALDDIACKVI